MYSIMKNIFISMSVIVLLALVCTGCEERYTTYSDAEYIMFADTLATYPVQCDVEYFAVPVVSTVVRDYDRTVAVEIIDKGSDAYEREHFTLKSNTVTIPAGKTRADVLVHGCYDNLDDDDTRAFIMRLVMPDALEMPLYGIETKVEMQKVGPFDINNFVGHCVVTSLFLYNYSQDAYQRLVKTELYPSRENSIICRDFLYDGYDIIMTFNPEDPLSQIVNTLEGQTVSDEASVFGIVYGDNRILVSDSPVYTSYFNSLGKYAEVWLNVYVNDLGNTYGTVGQFYNVLEWVTEEEAERLRNEEGM